MQKIISNDGTTIAYRSTGSGPSLVLVHGTSADHSRWGSVAPAYEPHFTVHAVERRGRGESGDAGVYAIEREFEDIAAVIESVPGPVDLLGHSFGAICSIEAALRTHKLRRLILYEPPMPAGTPIYAPGIIDRLQEIVDSGDSEDGVSTFFREVVRMPDRELALMKSLPAWRARLAAAHTIPRELRASNNYAFRPGRFRNLRVPTLLLLGGDSPSFFGKAIEMVHATLPESRVVVLPGQQHAAMNTAPALFNNEVLAFLTT